jgi:hypothetical protein
VYQEYADRERFESQKLNIQYLAAVLPAASKPDSANTKLHKMVKETIATLSASAKGVSSSRTDDLKRKWEQAYGIKWGSKEFDARLRDQELARKFMAKG